MFTKCQNNESIRKKLNWIIFGCQWDTRWADPLLKQTQSTNAIEMDYFGAQETKEAARKVKETTAKECIISESLLFMNCGGKLYGWVRQCGWW